MAIGYFNNQGYYVLVIFLVILVNVILQYVINNIQYIFIIINYFLFRIEEQKIREEIQGSITGFIIVFNFVFGIVFFFSSFVLFLIKERVIKVKYIQFVSGVQFIIFWVLIFCWDLINYMILCCILLFVFWVFDIKVYYIDVYVVYILFLLFMYGWVMLFFMYFLFFIFIVLLSGFVWLIMFNILVGKLFFL